jgi:hypothetical protein
VQELIEPEQPPELLVRGRPPKESQKAMALEYRQQRLENRKYVAAEFMTKGKWP